MFGAEVGEPRPVQTSEGVPQNPNKNGPIATTGERGALSRASVTLVIAIVALFVLPAHFAAGSLGATKPLSGPVMLGNAAPLFPADAGRTSLSPRMPRDPTPVAVYPSDTLSSSGSGPSPLLRSAIDRPNFPAAWAQGYRGAGVNIAVVDQGVDFGHPDLNASYAVEGNASSPYVGWPIAFDPKSMGTYLGTGLTDGTWYANTSATGPGPFEITHRIKVDGTNDFGGSERLGTDPRDDSGTAPGGIKADYDLTDLYATRDATRWYFGFSAYLEQSNDTYVLLLDVNNETGGTTTVPVGKFADTNTSATDIVPDIAFSPNGQQIATVSPDRYLRGWDRTGRGAVVGQRHPPKTSLRRLGPGRARC